MRKQENRKPDSSRFDIVPVRAEFLGQIYELEYISFSHPYSPGFIDALARTDPSTFLVALTNHNVVGYVTATVSGDLCHVISIAVHPHHRRNGIGSALMREVERACATRGATGMSLEVKRSNVIARAFYEKLGFAKSNEIRRYYEDGEDAIVYRKWVAT